jgi:predicted Holliday junction resolvase-like endonuclease
MEIVFDVYFREQRHIFGVCPNPDCNAISRLTDIRVSYRAKYSKDWLDRVDDETATWEDKKSELEETQKELKKRYIDKARRTVLPQKLRAISPLFLKEKVQPEDIKVVSNPLDFIGFDGLITNESLRRIVLLDSSLNKSFRGDVQRSIASLVENARYDWSVLRVDEEGKITQE